MEEKGNDLRSKLGRTRQMLNSGRDKSEQGSIRDQSTIH